MNPTVSGALIGALLALAALLFGFWGFLLVALFMGIGAVVGRIASGKLDLREVAGVYALGGGGARAFGAIRDVINATDLAQGVKVEVGETQAAADITIVVEYPAPVHEVAANVRAAVTAAITTLVGLEVVEVNVEVNDVHLPSDDTAADESRVS